MLRKELAQTGVFIPEVGIGTWDYRAGPDLLRRGLETGALFIDTAESYGTESTVGEAVKDIRKRVFLATKVSPQNFHPDDLRRSVDASLKRMGTDVIDLLQLHEPNPSIPIEETMGAVAGLLDAGKVRFAGVSNFSVTQLQEAQKALDRYPIVSNQVRYNIIDRTIESDLLPFCQSNHITVIAYCPLAGRLGRIWDCDPTGVFDELAKMTGRTPVQIIINWCLCRDGVVAIPKGNSLEHMLENCGSSDWRLTPEQLALLDIRLRHRRRSGVEQFVRKWMPASVRALAGKAIARLPQGWRWRFR